MVAGESYLSKSAEHDNLHFRKSAHRPLISPRGPLVNKRIALYKTEMCRTWEETGTCRYGLRCQFAHSPAELRVIPRHPRYKTEICKTFWEMGNCPYGKRCCFIHTEDELREGLGGGASLSVREDYFDELSGGGKDIELMEIGVSDGGAEKSAPIAIARTFVGRSWLDMPVAKAPGSVPKYVSPQSVTSPSEPEDFDALTAEELEHMAADVLKLTD